MVFESPVYHVDNVMQNTQQQLDLHLQKMQPMMQSKKMKYAAGPQNANQYYGDSGYHIGHTNYCGQGGRSAQCRVNWKGSHGGRVNRDITHYYWNHGMCTYLSKY